jgi:ABC-type taurine transport system ATPase subunit
MARVTPKITRRTRKRTARKALGKVRLEALVEEAIIDAYGESEQRVGFLTMLEDRLAVPFTTDILGALVRVERVDLNDAEEIVVICRRGRQRQLIPIVDLPLPSPAPVGWEWIEAYRHWVRGGR